jgi:hypothetical protein
MELPLHLTSRWGGKRYNSFNRVLKNTFNIGPERGSHAG